MDEETHQQWRLVLTPLGEPWSGRARYAAAMYFHKRLEMSAEVLEVYRICSRLDDEDPAEALGAYRIGRDWQEKLARMKRDLGMADS
jgi:hypothetical protein